MEMLKTFAEEPIGLSEPHSSLELPKTQQQNNFFVENEKEQKKRPKKFHNDLSFESAAELFLFGLKVFRSLLASPQLS